MGGKAVCDVKIVINDVQEQNHDNTSFLAPFDLQCGPLCWFAVDREKNILKGCIHHSIADGRSIGILLSAIATGQVKQSTKDYSVRKYAALEASEEMSEKYAASVEEWKRIMEDTPPRLEVDFLPNHDVGIGGGDAVQQVGVHDGYDSCVNHGTSSQNTNVTLDGATVSSLRSLCEEMRVSMFSVALSILHHTMRAYSHDSFAIGVAYDMRPRQFHDSVGMFINTVLVPFRGGKEGGCESVEELHQRWTGDILPHAMTPYDMVSSLGYGCNVYLAFNIGLLGGNNDDHGRAKDSTSATDGTTTSKMMYHSILSEVVDSVDNNMVSVLACIAITVSVYTATDKMVRVIMTTSY